MWEKGVVNGSGSLLVVRNMEKNMEIGNKIEVKMVGDEVC